MFLHEYDPCDKIQRKNFNYALTASSSPVTASSKFNANTANSGYYGPNSGLNANNCISNINTLGNVGGQVHSSIHNNPHKTAGFTNNLNLIYIRNATKRSKNARSPLREVISRGPPSDSFQN